MSSPTENLITPKDTTSCHNPDSTATAIPIKIDTHDVPVVDALIVEPLNEDEDVGLSTPVGSLKPVHGSFMKRAEVATASPVLEDTPQPQEVTDATRLEEDETELEKALRLRDKLDALLRRTIHTKQQCERLEHDNKYLQEFVGNLMNSGDYLSRKV